MLKNMSSLGKALNKIEQKAVIGGKRMCGPHCPCSPNETCVIPPGSSSGYCSTIVLF